jgi:hypothetical protein
VTEYVVREVNYNSHLNNAIPYQDKSIRQNSKARDLITALGITKGLSDFAMADR